MLSASLFCAILREFYNNKTIRAHFVSDKNELVDHCTKRQLYNHPLPNTMLEGEYDITEEIYYTHKNNKIEAMFGKVKGHWDQKERYKDLLFDTQFNVDTDWYAGEYQKKNRKRIPLALQYQSCLAYLIICNETITSNYCKQLINAYVKPIFLGYIQQKNEWENNTILDIAWKSLSLAAQQITKSVLLTKV